MKTAKLVLKVMGYVFLLLIATQPTAAQETRYFHVQQGTLSHPPSSVPDDVYWDSRFTTRGLSGQVNAIAVSGGNVYVGGGFTTAGKVIANSIAKWDGSTWTALGSGVSGGYRSPYAYVYAIAVSGNDVYVGGNFTTAGGVSASNIAKWNALTNTWSALGGGTDGTVYAITVSGGAVYVGGSFTTAGSVSANCVAKWDGSGWSALGSGVREIVTPRLTPTPKPPPSALTTTTSVPTPPPPPPPPTTRASVKAIAVSGNAVYVGGKFNMAGDVSANNVAKWNIPTSSWSALGSGVGGSSYSRVVAAIAVDGNDVYVGGNFTNVGSMSASGIAKWDGSSWSTLGNGVGGGYYLPFVAAIEMNGSDVYIGGNFTAAGNVGANNIARWDGSNWSALGSGVGGTVYALAANGADLFVGGSFGTAGGNRASGIAKWGGGGWSALAAGTNDGVSGAVYAVAVSDSAVYVGGTFAAAGGVSANNIARWDATTNTWSALESGVNGSVLAIAVSGNNVYVGGKFSSAGGVNANNIARWNAATNSWSALGSGVGMVGNAVVAIAVSGNDVYLGGDFTTAGGVSASRIAKWNMSTNSWSALGSGIGSSRYDYPGVYAIAVNGSDVYVGGTFTTAGTVSANSVAKWNALTNTWSALGSGVDYGYVNAISVSGSDVYVAGSFTSAGGVSTSNIARWNVSTNSWSALGSGVTGQIKASTLSGNDLYVGGYIYAAGGVSVRYIAKWNGCGWSALGSGVDREVNAIAASTNDVYVGGGFVTAGAKPSSYFARWSKPTTPPICLYYYFPIIFR